MSEKMLTTRQFNFCLQYVKLGNNGTQAAIAAGYSPKTSYAIANVNLKKAEIQERITQIRQEIQEKIVSERVMAEQEAQERLSDIARANLVDFIGRDGKPKLSKRIPHHVAAQEYSHRTRYDKDGNPTITKSVKLHNPISAIARLGELKGWFNPLAQFVNDNRTFNIVVSSEKAKQLTKNAGRRLLEEGKGENQE